MLALIFHVFRFVRCGYVESVKVVQNLNQGHISWNWMRVVVFDSPKDELQIEGFEFRYQLLLQKIPNDHPLLFLSPKLIVSFLVILPTLGTFRPCFRSFLFDRFSLSENTSDLFITAVSDNVYILRGIVRTAATKDYEFVGKRLNTSLYRLAPFRPPGPRKTVLPKILRRKHSLTAS